MMQKSFSEWMKLPESELNNNSIELLEAVSESLKTTKKFTEQEKLFYQQFLSFSRKSYFLQNLTTAENRNLWAELVFTIVKKIDFNFLSLFEQRCQEFPEKILFKETVGNMNLRYSYLQISMFMKEIAAFIYTIEPKKPKVAIFSANSVANASVDLACLAYDIFDSPLNIFFNEATLIYIFDILSINIVVTDTFERLRLLTEIKEKTNTTFKIIYTQTATSATTQPDFYLYKACKKISPKEATKILADRPRRKLNQTATTMFTSGSTGQPKGVSFSIYNIVSKRFARAAALPKVGTDEVLLSFLPLFHTFGRYLELTGTIFWGGTYIFAGNPSSSTLMALFPKVNPSIFISVPIRWVQLYEKCIKSCENIENQAKKKQIVRHIIGKKLHFGLSAAGYLSPKIFRFFQRNDVELCSGFGMTEATGGITMTPPGDYSENSTGLALPGIKTRLKENGELEISGHYLAKYLEDAMPDDIIPYPDQENYWLSTGDIFQIHPTGHHQIIDRVKDIYKNSKGQTVAPGMIENKFINVPGIKKTFLVGDARAYNVLLISPDNDDPILKATETQQEKNEYFHQIITSANKELAPYERIINFTILERDFSEDKNELTQKGSFRRKNIENNFKNLIQNLYKRTHIYFDTAKFQLSIPRWFFRDLGILENDIFYENEYLKNRRFNTTLHLVADKKNGHYIIGDFVYKITANFIDLGRMVRQPKLWAGNVQLINFSPCKDSFDLPVKNFSTQISLPENTIIYNSHELPQIKGIRNNNLVFINNLISIALHTHTSTALPALAKIETIFSDYDRNLVMIIRRRLEALATHSCEQIRIEAFRILLSEDPDPDFSEAAPAFISSGQSFLNEQSITQIASSNFSKHRLESLRKRMAAYRTGLTWPANEKTRKQIKTIFKLLLTFCKHNPNYYGSIRAEFASWMFLKNEPVLSTKAAEYMAQAYQNFEEYVIENTAFYNPEDWWERVIFDNGIPYLTKQEIISRLNGSQFLKQSLILTFEEDDFDLMQVPFGGIWISRVRSYRSSKHYRMSINTIDGKHFDLHISLDDELLSAGGQRAIHRYIAMDGHPQGQSVFPTFGCSSQRFGIISTKYVGQLAAWEKIRALSEVQLAGSIFVQPNVWRKLFIKSMAVFYRAWDVSGAQVMPGFVSPNNVVVPEADFSDNAKIISLSGYSENTKISDLCSAMMQNFYYKTSSHYPQIKKFLNNSWVFHACIEAFGSKKGANILLQLKAELENYAKMNRLQKDLYDALDIYINRLKSDYYLPLSLFNAIDKYADWRKKNPFAGANAIEQTTTELYELYELSKYPDIIRYKFYRETYFTEAIENIRIAFDNLLAKMTEDLSQLPIYMTELSELQMVLHDNVEKSIFAKMVFPNSHKENIVDILKVGKKDEKQVIVRTSIHDKNNVEYIMREPIEPSEVGALYKLFYKENYPKKISKMDNYYIVTNNQEDVIGGLCYKILDGGVVLLDGTAVTSPLHGRGIGSAMIEDFFSRMSAQGVKMVKAHFLFGNYYLKHNFKVDKNWGALIRKL